MSEITLPAPSLPRRWREVMRTGNPPDGGLDPVSRWLVLTRASVLPMTMTAGAVAGLLAVRHENFHPGWFALAFVGIVLAHASNNLMNDLFDQVVGLDTEQYPRALYAPHPILSGMITRSGLAAAALFVNGLDLGIGIVLFIARGWPILAFAFAGFLLSFAYTAPPLRLKKHGLGELDVLLVWGPLMVGGTYYAAVGEIGWQVLAASLPYALLCTAVLMGKHVDKIPWDRREQVHTLPVLLGEAPSRTLTRGLIVMFYAGVLVAVVGGALPWPVVVVAFALPTALKSFRALGRPRPDEPPKGFPIWPLWFAPIAFVHTRKAGAFLVLGLLIAALLNIGPSGIG